MIKSIAFIFFAVPAFLFLSLSFLVVMSKRGGDYFSDYERQHKRINANIILVALMLIGIGIKIFF